MTAPLITTGSQLRDDRVSRGYSIRSLAEALGLNKDTVQKYEARPEPLPIWFARAWRDLTNDVDAIEDLIEGD